MRYKTTSDYRMNFTGEFLPVKFVYKLPWFMCFQNRLDDPPRTSGSRPILEVYDLTFLLASFCFVKFTKNEFSGNDSNSIELTAVVLNKNLESFPQIIRVTKIRPQHGNSQKINWTYSERKIPSLFRIILYSYIIRFYRSWHWNKRVCWKQWFSFLGTTTISLLHYKLLRLIT